MNIAEYLETVERSQSWMARQLDVSPSLVSMWISGERLVTAEMCIPICRLSYTQISLHELRPDIYPNPRWKPGKELK